MIDSGEKTKNFTCARARAGYDITLNMKDLSWLSKYETFIRISLKFRLGLEVIYGGKRKSEFVSYNDTIGSVNYHEDKVELTTFAEYSDYKTGYR